MQGPSFDDWRDEGDRSPVALRRAEPADAELFVGWRSEPSAGRFLPPRRLGVDELRARLAAQPKIVDPELAGNVWFIVEANGRPVGGMSLKDIQREHGVGAIGYTIGERYRGRGYATAAVRALAALVLSPGAADLWRLEAVAAVENIASRRVLEKAGFRCEGIARSYLVIGGERVDHARYALLRPEWEEHGTGVKAGE